MNPRRGFRVLIASALLGFSILSGALYYGYESRLIRNAEYRRLEAVASLKADQIDGWRRQRIADARLWADNVFLRGALTAWRGDRAPSLAFPAYLARLQEWFSLEQLDEGVTDVLVVEAGGGLLASSHSRKNTLSAGEKRLLEEAVKETLPVIGDFVPETAGGISLAVIAPVLALDDRVAAYAVVRSESGSTLLETVRLWPTPSDTAEAVLVMKEGGDALVLNEPRFSRGSALSVRTPLSRTGEVSVRAVTGERGMAEGTDYRGVDVLADLRPVPQSPWLLVTKIDAKEFLSELQYRTMIASLLFLLFSILLGAILFGGFHHREARLFRDLYEEERAQRQLREEYRTTLYSIADAVITADTQGMTGTMNPTAERLTGWRETEARGKPLTEVLRLINEQTRDSVESPADNALLHGMETGLDNHTLLVSRDGTERPIADRGSPIRDEGGEVSGAVIVFRDQTAERAAQKALAESEEHYRTIFANAPFGIFRSTREGKILSANPALAALLGYDSPGQLVERINRESMALVLCEDPAVFDGLLEETICAAECKRHAVGMRAKNGTSVIASITMRRYFGSEDPRPQVEGFIEDMTERKKLQDQLLQSQKMEAIGMLAGGIAHDFNNLLTVIGGYCDMAMESAADESQRRECINEIRQAAHRAAALTSQLLAFSRRQVLRMGIMNLRGLLRKMQTILERLIGEDVALRVSPMEGLWDVFADYGKLEQVVLNLVVNARDAMPKGGELSIDVSNHHYGGESGFPAPGIDRGDYVLMRVRDSGIGMDAATVKRVFEPFFTTKEKGKGTGLGLATVYGIVKQMGGYVFCESEPGKGATFDVYLPRVEGGVREPLPPPSAPPQSLSGTETVLLVEDDDAVRALADSILKSAGYAVIAARGGAEAREIMSAGAAHPDLLVTDVIMPGMNGNEVAREVSAFVPGIGVLFMSGYAEDVIVHRGILDGEIELVQKPFTAAEFLRQVRIILNRRKK